MPVLTGKEKENIATRETGKRASAQSAKAGTQAVDAASMWAIGSEVEIGARVYEIAAFRVVVMGRVYAILDRLPMILRAHAVEASMNAGEFSFERTADRMRRMTALTARAQARVQATVRATLEAINEQRTADGQDLLEIPPDVDYASAAAETLTADVIEMSIANGEGFDEDTSEAMVDLVHLAILRRHEGATREEIEAELELPTFMKILAVIYLLNDGLRTRF